MSQQSNYEWACNRLSGGPSDPRWAEYDREPPEPERLYNGPHSALMDTLYDRLMEHTNLTEYNDWPVLSLYIAREIKRIEDEAV